VAASTTSRARRSRPASTPSTTCSPPTCRPWSSSRGRSRRTRRRSTDALQAYRDGDPRATPRDRRASETQWAAYLKVLNEKLIPISHENDIAEWTRVRNTEARPHLTRSRPTSRRSRRARTPRRPAAAADAHVELPRQPRRRRPAARDRRRGRARAGVRDRPGDRRRDQARAGGLRGASPTAT
jgi:hypothetical protein